MKKGILFSFGLLLVSWSISGQCPFTPTIEPAGLVLCYYEQDTLWTQEYDTYQWYRNGVPIPGATEQFLLVNGQSDLLLPIQVEATLDTCTEKSASVLVDGWLWIPFYIGGFEFTGGENYWIDTGDPANPTDDIYHICSDGFVTFGYDPTTGWINPYWIDQQGNIVGEGTEITVTKGGVFFPCAYLEICPEHYECLPFGMMEIVKHETVIPEIIASGDSLIATQGKSYQWFLDGSPISGANDPVYVPVESGSYTVEVEDENQCSDISDPFEFAINSLGEEVGKDLEWRVFPNPATDRVQIRYSSSTPASAELFNSLGQRLMSKELNGGTASFLLNNLPDGIYWIRLQADGASQKSLPLLFRRK
jgi:hypothetical protein